MPEPKDEPVEAPTGVNSAAPVVGASEIEIDSTPEAVWEVLTAFELQASREESVTDRLAQLLTATRIEPTTPDNRRGCRSR